MALLYLLLALAGLSHAQSSPPAGEASLLTLAEQGKCTQAIPGLKHAGSAPDRDFRRSAEILGLRCAMTLNSTDDTLSFLQMLSRDFPDDPEVLYLKTHAYSDLSIRASQDLIARAPDSYQVHLLNAESLEVQGQWKEALEEYRKVLAKNPQARGVHYRVGRLVLSQPNVPNTAREARAEFEAELKINPDHPGAEYVLGELARRDEKWDEAAAHFAKAAALDPNFADAYLSLGRSLMEAGKYTEAIKPLEAAAKLQPENPEVHFRLASAYRQSGRAADANRELALHRDTSERARRQKETIQKKIEGIQ